MKRLWPLVALGVALYLVFALVTLPARVVASWLPDGVVLAGAQGTVWNGHASVLMVGNTQIGSVDWDLHVLPLFTLQAKADLKITRPEGFVQSVVATRGGSSVSLTELTGSLPLRSLPPSAMPGGWTGTMNLKFASLTLENGWPTSADGALEIIDLVGPARKPAKLGSYKIIFPPEQAGDSLLGALSDLGGPLEIAGNVRLNPDRSYLVEGSVAARPEADKSLADSLQILGPPDAQGRRPFSLSGTT